MKKFLIVITALFAFSSVFGQKADFPWTDFKETNVQFRTEVERPIIPNKYRTVKLDKSAMQNVLNQATIKDLSNGMESNLLMTFPMPDGTNQVFKIYEAPVMHPDLAAKYPSIKTYAGFGIDDPTAYVRFGTSPSGFHAVVKSARTGSNYIDTYSKSDTDHYISYHRKDFEKKEGFDYKCKVEAHEQVVKDLISDEQLQMRGGDCQIRKYRLALTANGEYSAFHGGTVELVLAELVKAVNRINSIFEIDFSVTLELVADSDKLIYLNPSSDPFGNTVTGGMLSTNQQVCDDVIGNDNYDIGHIFCTGDGGLASLGVVCNNANKAQGATGLPNPTGDPFWVEYACHELGHQFDANHTFNNACGNNRSSRNAMEPGSGSTIMSYIGICAPNLGTTGQADPFFHAQSLMEVYDFITTRGDGCAIKTQTGNNNPTAVAGEDKILPVSTPFVLGGSAQDDGNSTLTYTWEQMDPEIGAMPPRPTNAVGPMFRFINPDETPERYFPNLNDLVNNVTPTWEVLPSVSRNMDFRFVVRDNAPGNGCVDEDDLQLTFDDSAGPFIVQAPNDDSQTWLIGETRRVSWDVANTDQAPVSCADVDILLSLDGGLTYMLLIANVANDGQHDIVVPELLTEQARIMVKCSDNYFFDISNENFSIEYPPEPTFFMTVAETDKAVCSDQGVTFDIEFTSLLNFDEPIALNLSNAPSGAAINFSNNSITPPGSSQLTIAGLENVASGVYPMTLTGTTPSKTNSVDLELTIYNGVPQALAIAAPTNGQMEVSLNEELQWSDNSDADTYLLEVATSPAFGSTIVASETVNTTVFSIEDLDLDFGVIYYWRVTPTNLCGVGAMTEIFAFKTLQQACTAYQSSNLPATINIPEAATYTEMLTIPNDGNIFRTNVLVEFDHTWIGDLSARLISPAGTEVELFDRPSFPAISTGCSEDGIRVIFDDDAALTDVDFEATCNTGAFAIEGVYQPVGSLGTLANENPKGEWTLEFADAADLDGGALVDWQIEICQTLAPLVIPDLLTNQALDVNQNESGLVAANLLMGSSVGNAPSDIIFQIRRNVTQGTLRLGGVAIGVGSTFTQADIDNNNLTYQHNGGTLANDAFTFDLFNAAGGWLSNQVFNINIEFNTVAVTASQTRMILCNGANNGQITINGSGGTPPFEYSLNGGTFQSNNVFDQLTPGDYIPMIRDANGFEQTAATITISEPMLLTAGNNVMNDVVSISVSGGTAFYEFSLDGINFQMSNVFMNVANGAYDIVVRDANGCLASTSAVVAVNSLVASATLLNDITCTDANDARVEINVAGGTAPYLYSLNGLPAQMSNVFENVWAGSHVVTIFDSDGFQVNTNQIIVTNPAPIVMNVSTTGNMVTVTASGGTGVLRYSINGGAFQTNNTFTDLINGNYLVSVKDDNDCVLTENTTVAVNRVTISANVVQDNICFNENIGIIEATGAGGTAPYQYQLNNGNFQASNRFENLAPGNYTVTTRDADNFTQTSGNINISQPSQINATAMGTGYDITVSANGGMAPLEYSLDGMTYQGSNIFRNNTSGNYTIYVKDANGCVVTSNATINVAVLGLSGVITTPVQCNGENDGIVTLMASGGFAPFTYSLDGLVYQQSNVFSNLGAGNYTFYVKDAGEFVETFEIELVEPNLLVLGAPTFANETMTFNATGGTGAYEYSFNGGTYTTDNSIVNFESGQDYIVVVRDANGCVKTGTFSLSAVQARVDLTVDCSGVNGTEVEVIASGGLAPYTYSLDGTNFDSGNVFTNLPSGDQTYYVMDAAGFQYTFVAEAIPNYPMVATADINFNNVEITIANGVPPYRYKVDSNPFTFSNMFVDLTDGDHLFTVRDGNNCEVSITETITTSSLDDLSNRLFFEINPNPSSGNVTLKMNQPTNRLMIARVFDVVGRLVYQEKFAKQTSLLEKNFDLQLQPGNYLMIIEDGQFLGRKQLIIVK